MTNFRRYFALWVYLRCPWNFSRGGKGFLYTPPSLQLDRDWNVFTHKKSSLLGRCNIHVMWEVLRSRGASSEPQALLLIAPIIPHNSSYMLLTIHGGSQKGTTSVFFLIMCRWECRWICLWVCIYSCCRRLLHNKMTPQFKVLGMSLMQILSFLPLHFLLQKCLPILIWPIFSALWL